MKRVAITGADTRNAGELIRILIFHPDIELVQFVSEEKAGQRVDAVHHGLVAETDAVFSACLHLVDVDLVIDCGDEVPVTDFFSEGAPMLVWLPRADKVRMPLPEGMVYGQPEANRKPLVRGARGAVVPSPVASVVIATVLPLVKLLPEESLVKVKLRLPLALSQQLISPEDAAAEVETALKVVAGMPPDEGEKPLPAFRSKFVIEYAYDRLYERGVSVQAQLPLHISPEDALAAYNAVYDDHNFSYNIARPVGVKEVEGTEKCLIALRATPDGIVAESVADARMRGGAGEAVHLMNLLFGLQEQTGLMLKCAAF